MEFKSSTVLITGASSGLGEEFARQLAASGANLVLVARSEDKLNAVADELRRQGGIIVTVIPANLSSGASVQQLIDSVTDRSLKIDVLVNNAGLGLFKNFLDAPLQGEMDQIAVNVCALVALTRAFAPAMVAAKRGGIINIASTAAFQPLAGAAIYAASKAFVLFFSEALSFELNGSGVRVLAVCPGALATNFFDKMKKKLAANSMEQPTMVVRETLRAFHGKQRVIYPGKLQNWLGTFGARFLPRDTMLLLGSKIVGRMN